MTEQEKHVPMQQQSDYQPYSATYYQVTPTIEDFIKLAERMKEYCQEPVIYTNEQGLTYWHNQRLAEYQSLTEVLGIPVKIDNTVPPGHIYIMQEQELPQEPAHE
jgi:hypothetical protein